MIAKWELMDHLLTPENSGCPITSSQGVTTTNSINLKIDASHSSLEDNAEHTLYESKSDQQCDEYTPGNEHHCSTKNKLQCADELNDVCETDLIESSCLMAASNHHDSEFGAYASDSSKSSNAVQAEYTCNVIYVKKYQDSCVANCDEVTQQQCSVDITYVHDSSIPDHEAKDCLSCGDEKTVELNDDASVCVDQLLKQTANNVAGRQLQVAENQQELARYQEQLEALQLQLVTVVQERDAAMDKVREVEQKSNSDITLEELHALQTKELETTIKRLEAELVAMHEKLVTQDAFAKKAISSIQLDMKTKADQLLCKFEEANKEKSATVMRYAQSEQKNIELQDKLLKADTKLKDATKEMETLKSKLKTVIAEKQKYQETLENRSTEIIALRREVEKYKEVATSADIRAKWAQNKLQTDMDTSKETKVKLDDALHRLKEAREELDQVRLDVQTLVRNWQPLQQSSDELTAGDACKDIEQKSDMTGSEQKQLTSAIRKELENLKKCYKEMCDESKSLRDRIIRLDSERLGQDEILAKYRSSIQSQKTEIKDLKDRVAKVDMLADQLKTEQSKNHQLQHQVDELQQLVQDMRGDVENASIREADHLDVTKRLTDRTTLLQSDNLTLKSKLDLANASIEKLTTYCGQLEEKNNALKLELTSEVGLRSSEVDELRRIADEYRSRADEVASKLEESEDQIKTMKRKHAAVVKDLTRQLTMSKKRVENNELGPGATESSAGFVAMGSRTGSTTSLDTATTSSTSALHQSPVEALPSLSSLPLEGPIVEVIEVDKQLLLDKIVRLQKVQARRQEKIDFLEEHVTQLLSEVRKKSRIIQQFAMREEAGALAPEAMDMNKAELAKRGGVMASLYNLHSLDGTITLELALEIGKKLQAVLEDTMLKNITLKENLDTLGKEISRLSQENRHFQLQLLRETNGSNNVK